MHVSSTSVHALDAEACDTNESLSYSCFVVELGPHLDLRVLHFLQWTQVAQEARAKHQAAAEASQHAMKSALYWKGTIGRAHSSLTRSALQQVGKAQREANQGLVCKGRERQAKGKKQHQEGQVMNNYHSQLNMLRAFIQRTDFQHR